MSIYFLCAVDGEGLPVPRVAQLWVVLPGLSFTTLDYAKY